MKISKDSLQYFVGHMPDKIDVLELFDKLLLMAKIEQANEEEHVSNHFELHPELHKEMDMWG